MNVSIVSACWGNYWQRFGKEFCDSIESLNTKPHEVIVVSDCIADYPEWLKVIYPFSSVRKWDWLNEAVLHATGEWVWLLGIDDLAYAHGLDGIVFEGDVIAIGATENGKSWIPDQLKWNSLLFESGNPMAGGMICKRSAYLRYPLRNTTYSDWMQWLEMRHSGVDVRFDQRERFIHRKHADANSFAIDENGLREIENFKRHLIGAKLNLGCGPNHREGWINLDINPPADLIHDISVTPWPIAGDSIREVYSSHCFEHIDNIFAAFDEICRICRIGAPVEIRVPHPLSEMAMCAGHKHIFSPQQALNHENYFGKQIWRHAKRLRLDRIAFEPTEQLAQAKRDLPFLRGLSDHVIMRWIPNTCHESIFRFTVITNEHVSQA